MSIFVFLFQWIECAAHIAIVTTITCLLIAHTFSPPSAANPRYLIEIVSSNYYIERLSPSIHKLDDVFI
jgi:hypothetical protein